MSDCKNSKQNFGDIFAGSAAEKCGFQPTHAAFGGAKPSGFCRARFCRWAPDARVVLITGNKNTPASCFDALYRRAAGTCACGTYSTARPQGPVGAEGVVEDEAKGIAKAKGKIARSMLQAGMPVSQVASLVSLTQEEIENIKNSVR